MAVGSKEKPKITYSVLTVNLLPFQVSCDAVFLGAEPRTLLIPCRLRARKDFREAPLDSEAVGRKTDSAMWLISVLLPLARLYLCGIKVLLYQTFNRSFTLPGLFCFALYLLHVCHNLIITCPR